MLEYGWGQSQILKPQIDSEKGSFLTFIIVLVPLFLE